MNKMTAVLLPILAFSAMSAFAAGETATGTLAVTGTIDGTLMLTLETASTGVDNDNLSLSGSNVESAALGTISKTASAPAGWSKSVTASDWKLSTYVGVKVDKANIASGSHTLTAKLASVPESGISWKMGAADLSTVDATVDDAGVYESTADYQLAVDIADSAADDSAIDNTITLVATAN